MYIVSLTTTPFRFGNLYQTVDSLLRQSIVPDQIVINIPKQYNLRMENLKISEDSIKAFLEHYANKNHIVMVNEIEKDYGPGTKLLGIVKNFDNTEEDIYLVLVDDDMIYKPYMLEHFDTFRRLKEKEEMEMVDVASYYVYDKNNILIGQGADGFFIRWKCLSDFLRYFEIFENEDYLLYHDDYYISFYFHLLQKKIHRIDTPDYELIYTQNISSDIFALHKMEGKYNRSCLNQKCFEILTDLDQNKRAFEFLHQK